MDLQEANCIKLSERLINIRHFSMIMLKPINLLILDPASISVLFFIDQINYSAILFKVTILVSVVRLTCLLCYRRSMTRSQNSTH